MRAPTVPFSRSIRGAALVAASVLAALDGVACSGHAESRGLGDASAPPAPPMPPPPVMLPPPPPALPPPPCTTDEFVYVGWVLDGVAGEVCSPDASATGAIDNCTMAGCPPISPGILSFSFGAYPQCFVPHPYTSVGLYVYNTELLEGAGGSLQAEEGRLGRLRPLAAANDAPAYAEVHLRFDYRGPGDCGPPPSDVAFSTGGTWHVVRAGSFGEMVEVEARDVTFGATSPGHEIRLTRVYWRVRIRSLPPLPPFPREMDGGS